MSNELSPEGLCELRKYADRVGDNWKESLLHDWARAGTRVHGIEYAYLHCIRNRFGPSWLETFEFPPDHVPTMNSAEFTHWLENGETPDR